MIKECFKVGDKIECINRAVFAPVGTKGVIKEINRQDGCIVQWDTNVGGCEYSDIAIPKGYGEWIYYGNIKKIEPAQQVIINGATTIFKKDNKTYKTTCQDDDTFDAEKGVMLALLQSYGVTYKDIKELVLNAKVIKPKSVRINKLFQSLKLRKKCWTENGNWTLS